MKCISLLHSLKIIITTFFSSGGKPNVPHSIITNLEMKPNPNLSLSQCPYQHCKRGKKCCKMVWVPGNNARLECPHKCQYLLNIQMWAEKARTFLHFNKFFNKSILYHQIDQIFEINRSNPAKQNCQKHQGTHSRFGSTRFHFLPAEFTFPPKNSAQHQMALQ